jgi:proteasome lid subunit RPN8/RPN11
MPRAWGTIQLSPTAARKALTLNRSLSSPRPALVIYHSHPNGRAYFSATDQEVATSPWGDGPAYPVQHLVIGINEIARYDGASL